MCSHVALLGTNVDSLEWLDVQGASEILSFLESGLILCYFTR